MGMFNYVDYECVCPICHNKVDGFQTKDGKLELKKVKPNSVCKFYSTCSKCGCFIEFTAKEITNFTMTVTGKKNGKFVSLLKKEVKIKENKND